MSSKNPIIKVRSLFKGIKKRNIYAKNKSISLNNLTLVKRDKLKIEQSPNKILNAIEFIKQKNRFFIKTVFDAKGTREFLASKEVAMKIIKLNDEIEEKNIKEKEHSIIQKNLLHLDLMNSSKSTKKNNSSKTACKRTLSPKKSRKKSKRKNLEEKLIEEKENKKQKKSSKKLKKKISNNSSNIESNIDSNKEKNNIIMEDKADNNSSKKEIYKLYIDNESESDNNFQKKLKKEINKCVSMKNIQRIKMKNKERMKFQSKKDFNYKRPKRLESSIIKNKSQETQSIFLFSEINKNKMEEDDMNISSIGEIEKICVSPKKKNKKKVKRLFNYTINKEKKRERSCNQFDGKEANENEEGRVEIKSDKDSLISILSDLI